MTQTDKLLGRSFGGRGLAKKQDLPCSPLYEARFSARRSKCAWPALFYESRVGRLDAQNA